MDQAGSQQSKETFDIQKEPKEPEQKADEKQEPPRATMQEGGMLTGTMSSECSNEGGSSATPENTAV